MQAVRQARADKQEGMGRQVGGQARPGRQARADIQAGRQGHAGSWASTGGQGQAGKCRNARTGRQ